jgi:hypothetical protein
VKATKTRCKEDMKLVNGAKAHIDSCMKEIASMKEEAGDAGGGAGDAGGAAGGGVVQRLKEEKKKYRTAFNSMNEAKSGEERKKTTPVQHRVD